MRNVTLPLGVEGPSQCQTLKCRKVFNRGNYAFINVRRAGEAEDRRHSLGCKFTSQQLYPNGRKSSLSSENTDRQSQSQTRTGNLAGAVLVFVRAPITGRTPVPRF